MTSSINRLVSKKIDSQSRYMYIEHLQDDIELSYDIYSRTLKTPHMKKIEMLHVFYYRLK